MRKNVTLAAGVLAAVVLASCGGEQMRKIGAVRADQLTAEDYAALRNTRLFFAHQSVGNNLLEGIGELYAAAGQPAPARAQGRDGGAVVTGITDAAVGQNEDPFGKVADFEALLAAGIGDKAQVAAMKLCYVDFNRSTDVDKLFAAYTGAVDRIQAAYPSLRLVHFTVPVTAPEPGLRNQLMSLLGQGYEKDNDIRARYNQLLRSRFAPEGRLFDIAAAEASDAQGNLPERKVGSLAVQDLRKEFTSDGGHLNETGRQRVAAEFVRFVAALK